MTNYVKDWFMRADDDLKLVEVMLKEESFSPNPLCFHSQQAAEKYLKGFLAYKDLHTRKVHDLEVLVKDCEKIDNSFNKINENAKFLNQFYIEARYPGDYPEFSHDDAKKAYQNAIEVRSFILEKIK